MRKAILPVLLALLTLPAMSQGKKYKEAMGAAIEKMHKASDALLDRAKKWLDTSMELAPEESEVHVLEPLYYIGLMSVDPMTRGQLYYEDVLAAIRKALSLNPKNPRAYFLDGMMTVNLPEFLGGGPEAAKTIFLEAEEKFKAFQNDDPFWPIWGEDLNQDEIDRLNE